MPGVLAKYLGAVVARIAQRAIAARCVLSLGQPHSDWPVQRALHILANDVVAAKAWLRKSHI